MGVGACSNGRQAKLGPQSRRGMASQKPMDRLRVNPYALGLFESLDRNEEQLCGDYAVFYHSYSWAALLYEVRAAIAAVLFGFPSSLSPLPRLIESDYVDVPNAKVLMHKVKKEWAREKVDHVKQFRLVGISAMCSLVATGPECCLQVAFGEGYSCKNLDFRGMLETMLQPFTSTADGLVDKVVAACEMHGLDTSMFGGTACDIKSRGHIVQIFIRRSLVDRLCYPAIPYGAIDERRLPFAAHMAGDRSFSFGQARLLARPRYFLQPSAVRMFVISANPVFQAERVQLQSELTMLFEDALKSPGVRATAIRAIAGKYGASLGKEGIGRHFCS